MPPLEKETHLQTTTILGGFHVNLEECTESRPTFRGLIREYDFISI